MDNLHTLLSSNSTSRFLSENDSYQYIPGNMYRNVQAALFIPEVTGKQFKWPSTEEWINTCIVCLHNYIRHSS